MRAARVDDRAVDFNHGHRLDVVAQHLAQGAAIAATDDQDLAGAPMREHWDVGQHFVIRELVPFGRLNDAVKGEHPAKGRSLENYQVLKFRPRAVDNPGDFETLCKSLVLDLVMQRLVEPFHEMSPRFCSPNCMDWGAKASRRAGTAS